MKRLVLALLLTCAAGCAPEKPHGGTVLTYASPYGPGHPFSRADLAGASRGGPALRHAGVYAFRRDLLWEFAGWPPGRLETAERLEQLRAVERGVRIHVVLGDRPFAGVDTPEQMAALEARGPLV